MLFVVELCEEFFKVVMSVEICFNIGYMVIIFSLVLFKESVDVFIFRYFL